MIIALIIVDLLVACTIAVIVGRGIRLADEKQEQENDDVR